MPSPALFLDRDGTLVHPRHYPTTPEELCLYDGIGPLLAALQGSGSAAGLRLVVITNQSGLARGLFDAAALVRMHNHLTGELARSGARLDGIYYCPHHPEGTVPELAVTCPCRKPAPGLLLQAAQDLDLDLAASWFIGDILDDVEAGNRAGCRTILVDLGTEGPPDRPERRPTYVAPDTCHALRIVGATLGRFPPADLTYLPPSWRTPPRSSAGRTGFATAPLAHAGPSGR